MDGAEAVSQVRRTCPLQNRPRRPGRRNTCPHAPPPAPSPTQSQASPHPGIFLLGRGSLVRHSCPPWPLLFLECAGPALRVTARHLPNCHTSLGSHVLLAQPWTRAIPEDKIKEDFQRIGDKGHQAPHPPRMEEEPSGPRRRNALLIPSCHVPRPLTTVSRSPPRQGPRGAPEGFGRASTTERLP